MSEIISNKYESDINKELSLLRNQVHDNKLNTFPKIYSNFSLQKYLSFGLPKAKTKELSKLRVSAHELLIERSCYFKPQVTREKRLCTTCDKVENGEHFMLRCSKFPLLRNDLFNKLNIDYHDLSPNVDQSFKIFNRLMNPVNVEETKHAKVVCEYI